MWRRPCSVSVGKPYWPTRRTNIALTASGRRQAPSGWWNTRSSSPKSGPTSSRSSSIRVRCARSTDDRAAVERDRSAAARRLRFADGHLAADLRDRLDDPQPAGVEVDVASSAGRAPRRAACRSSPAGPTARAADRSSVCDCARNDRRVAASHAWMLVGLLAGPRRVGGVGRVASEPAPPHRVLEGAVQDRVDVADGAPIETLGDRRPPAAVGVAAGAATPACPS